MLLKALQTTGIAALAVLASYAGYSAMGGKKLPGASLISASNSQEDGAETTVAARQIRGLPERQETTSQNGTETTAKTEDGMTTNPVRADKQDDGKFFTTNTRRVDKADDGKFFSTNPRLVAKKDDGDFFTENTSGGEFNPCLKADGTPYQGPGTALNPFAPTNPCLPTATAESYAVYTPEVTPEPEPVPTRTVLPYQRDYFAPEPALPSFGSDYKTI